MKFSQKIMLPVFAVLALAIPAQAQLDLVSSTRAIVITPPTLLTYGTPNVTNGPIDLHGYIGRAFVDLNSFTNAGGAVTATIQTSQDTTNWTSLTNFLLISTTNLVPYTNGYYGGGSTLVVSNAYLIPGTFTSSTPGNSSNAFAGTWLNYTPYTNGGAITITGKGIYRVGFSAPDITGRYMQIYYQGTGANTNDVVSAVLTGQRTTEVQ